MQIIQFVFVMKLLNTIASIIFSNNYLMFYSIYIIHFFVSFFIELGIPETTAKPQRPQPPSRPPLPKSPVFTKKVPQVNYD